MSEPNNYQILWRLINYKENPHVWEMIVITPRNVKFMGHIGGIREISGEFIFNLFKTTKDIFFIEIETIKESVKETAKTIKLLNEKNL